MEHVSEVDMVPAEAERFFLADNPIPFSINSASDANRRLWALKKLKQEEEKIELEMMEVQAETQAFYQKKLESKRRAFSWLQGPLEAFVRNSGENLSLPNGKAIVKRLKVKEWGDEDAVFAYALANGFVRVKQEVDKKALEAHLKMSDPSNPLLQEHEEQRFYVQFDWDKEIDKAPL
jgi:phage host-nuclease inhibitor protein Gam